MSAKHTATPGPWVLSEEISDSGAKYSVITGADGVEVFGEGGFWFEADERLAIAAPDLLAALEHAVHWHDQLSKQDVDRMRAAIARARGA